MNNQLIPEEEFQTAVPSNIGLLTLRSKNTESLSNNKLLDTFGLNLLDINLTTLEYENLSPESELITSTVPIESLPVVFYTQGTCFSNLESASLITDKDLLFIYLCDVLIRFDASPNHYQKEDFEALIRVLTSSLIYLYGQDEQNNKSISGAPFLGIATPLTNPITYAAENNYKLPGVYVVRELGVYTNFNITVTEADIDSSVVMLLPNIIDGVFINYRKEIYRINSNSSGSGTGTDVHNSLDGLQGGDASLDEFVHITTAQLAMYEALAARTYENELMLGNIDGINKVFTTTKEFVNGSLVVYVNGLKIRNYTIDSNFQITLEDAPSNIGIPDIIEATYISK